MRHYRSPNRKRIRLVLGSNFYERHPVHGHFRLRHWRIAYIAALVAIALIFLQDGAAAILAASVLDVR